MDIYRCEVGQMKANCFIIADSQGEALIIDPGDDADYIISTTQRNNLNPQLIIATHGHIDHIMAALEIKLAFGIPLYMHELDEFLLDRMEKSAQHFLGFDPGPAPDVDFYLEGGSKVNVGDIELEVINTPGHTPGSITLFSRHTKDLFVGDLIFGDGSVGRTDFAYSDKQSMLRSIRHIVEMKLDITVHSGHGDDFLLSEFQTLK